MSRRHSLPSAREHLLALRLYGICRIQQNGGIFHRGEALVRDSGFRRLLELSARDTRRLLCPCPPLWHWQGKRLVVHLREIERRCCSAMAAASLITSAPHHRPCGAGGESRACGSHHLPPLPSADPSICDTARG